MAVRIFPTLPLSDRQRVCSVEADYCWRPAHSKGLLDAHHSVGLDLAIDQEEAPLKPASRFGLLPPHDLKLLQGMALGNAESADDLQGVCQLLNVAATLGNLGGLFVELCNELRHVFVVAQLPEGVRLPGSVHDLRDSVAD